MIHSYTGAWSKITGTDSSFWIKDESVGDELVYYELIEGKHTDVEYTSKTFTSSNIKYIKDPQHSCLVARFSETTARMLITLNIH